MKYYYKTPTPKKLNKPEMYTLEQNQAFSKSKIWQLQREYFESSGINAWQSREVPHYITSNPTVAKTYAEIVLSFLRDLALKESFNGTVYLLELGAGHGRLCYHFLKYFTRFYEQNPLKLPQFCYILSDFTEKNLKFWETHIKLQPFLENGMLDFALFDAEQDKEIKLRRSGKVISIKSLKQPLIVVGNYFFDTIPQELFYLEDQEMYQCLLSLSTDLDPTDTPRLLENLKLQYDYRKLDTIPYEESYLQSLLEYYRSQLSGTHLNFPFVSIRCIERLRQLSSRGLMLLTADKGYHNKEDLACVGAPQLVTHGSFSLTVNYHAMELYCKNSGGLPMFPQRLHSSIDVGCLLFLNDCESYRETINAFERNIDNFGPDDFFRIKKFIEYHIHDLTLPDIFSTLRFSGYDANIFNYMLPQFHQLLPQITENERQEISRMVHKVWDMYYPIGDKPDIAFEIGIILLRLEFYKDAAVYFLLSAQIYGYTKELSDYLSFCYQKMET